MSFTNIKELFTKRTTEAEGFNLNEELNASSELATHLDDHKPVKCDFKSLNEQDAGITEYLNKNVGFSAVIKERFSDFQVHEIDLDGNVVRLTNFDIPPPPETTLSETTDDIIDKSTWDELKNLEEKKITSVKIDVSNYDKDKRRKIHKLIKEKYQKKFITNTVISGENQEIKSIVVTLGKDTRAMWPYGRGDYLHFVLYKVNMDTMDAVNLIASKLGTKPSNLTYAGTKDKRGKTSQQVSMWHMTAERLNSLNKCLRFIRVGNFSYKKKQVKLGDLTGNEFRIALRNVTAENEIINSALNSLKDNGFINYFGLQRFGNSPDVPTFKIGKSLVKGDFKNAVELILKPRLEITAKDSLDHAKRIWFDSKNAKKAYDSLDSKKYSLEGKLLLGLAKHGNNAYVNALENLPRNVRLLYLHSYQSLLWNKIVSKRMKEFGTRVLEGDLVFVKCHDMDQNNEDNVKEDSITENKSKVRCITSSELKDFELSDIVHPLPGYNITYPNNIIGVWYEELLNEEGLVTEEFKQRVKEYTLSGTYRHIVKNVKDLSWNIVFYSKPEDDLIMSDLDIINEDVSNYSNSNDGEHKAVVMTFSLDSSTYATMALRELLKIDTSSSFQASLNSYSNKRKSNTELEDKSSKKKIKE